VDTVRFRGGSICLVVIVLQPPYLAFHNGSLQIDPRTGDFTCKLMRKLL